MYIYIYIRPREDMHTTHELLLLLELPTLSRERTPSPTPIPNIFIS